MEFRKGTFVNQILNNDTEMIRAKVSVGDMRLEKITRSILKLIKDADASSAGGVRADIVRKIITDEIKKEKLK